MRNSAANFWNSTTGTGLYCVWVRVHDDGGDRLVSRWIDPATDRAQITTSKNDVWNRPGCYSLVRRERELMWTRLMRKIRSTFSRFAAEEFRSKRRQKCFGITLQFGWDWHSSSGPSSGRTPMAAAHGRASDKRFGGGRRGNVRHALGPCRASGR
jgi:hypothetical protein